MNGRGLRDDADLPARAAAGDGPAFADLMRHHREPIYRLVRSYVGDPDEALDLTQEAFLAAYGAIRRYDPAQPFRAWVSRIAINKCRDWQRRRAVRSFFTFARPIEDAFEIAADRPVADEELAARQEMAALDRAVADLPANLKEPLLLRTVEGLSQAETARLLGISEKAVETRLYRARARLRTVLEARGMSAGAA